MKSNKIKQHLRDVTDNCRIRIDKEGRWFYEGCEIINPLVLRSFCDALETDEQGQYRIVIGDEVCYIEVEDTPFVISAIRGDQATGLYIRLNTMQTYQLDPSKLHIGEDNVLYITLGNGMKLRFTRNAYYSLAQMMEEEDNTIVLKIADNTYPICPCKQPY